jgi:hypothetical protein
MPNQHNVPEALEFDDAEHVGNVQRPIDSPMQQVRPLAQTGERRREHNMTMRSQPVGNALPAPASVPRTVHKDEGMRSHVRAPVRDSFSRA